MSENISEVLLFTYIPFVLLVLILLSNKPKEETRDIKFYWGNRIQERINLKVKIAKFNSTIHLYSGILFCTSGV